MQLHKKNAMKQYTSLNDDSIELIKIITSIIKKEKGLKPRD